MAPNRANQSVRLANDAITISNSTPYVTAVGPTGRSGAFTQSANTGVVFSLAGRAATTGKLELDLNISLSSMSESNAQISADVKAQMIHRATIAHKGTVEAGKAFVVVCADASSPDANGNAVAYIARVTLSAPQPGAGASRGEGRR